MYFNVHIILPIDRNTPTRSTANSNKPDNAWRSIGVPIQPQQTLRDLVLAAQQRANQLYGGEILSGYDCDQLQDPLGTELVLSDQVGDLFERDAPQSERALYLHLQIKENTTASVVSGSSGALPDVYDIEDIEDDEVDGGNARVDSQGFKIPRKPSKLPRKRRASSVLVSSSPPEQAPPVKRPRTDQQAPTPPTSSPHGVFALLNGDQTTRKKGGNWSEEEDAIVRQGMQKNLNSNQIWARMLPNRTASAIRARRTYLKQRGVCSSTKPSSQSSSQPQRSSSDQAARASTDGRSSNAREKSPIVLVAREAALGSDTSQEHSIQTQEHVGSRPATNNSDETTAATTADESNQASQERTRVSSKKHAAKVIGDTAGRRVKPSKGSARGNGDAPDGSNKDTNVPNGLPDKTTPNRQRKTGLQVNGKSVRNRGAVAPKPAQKQHVHDRSDIQSTDVPPTAPQAFPEPKSLYKASDSFCTGKAKRQPFFSNIKDKDRYWIACRATNGDPVAIKRHMEDAKADEDMINAVINDDKAEIDSINAMRRYRASQRAIEDGKAPPALENRLEGLNMLIATDQEEADEEFGPQNDFGAQEEDRDGSPLSPMRKAFMEDDSESEDDLSDSESVIQDREFVEVDDAPSEIAVASTPAPPMPPPKAPAKESSDPTGKKHAARNSRRSRAAERRRSRKSVSSKVSVSQADVSSVAGAFEDKKPNKGADVSGSWAQLLSEATFPSAPKNCNGSRQAVNEEPEGIVYSISESE